jgi:hypothetical protein
VHIYTLTSSFFIFFAFVKEGVSGGRWGEKGFPWDFSSGQLLLFGPCCLYKRCRGCHLITTDTMSNSQIELLPPKQAEPFGSKS